MLEILLTVLHPLLGGTDGGFRTRTGISVGGRGKCSSGTQLAMSWCCGTGLLMMTKKRSGAATDVGVDVGGAAPSCCSS